jgi:hypothetical protein
MECDFITYFKENLGGFMSMEQMNDVWGLSPEVIGALNSHFKVYTLPAVHKIDINNASLKDCSPILDMLWQKKLSSIEA